MNHSPLLIFYFYLTMSSFSCVLSSCSLLFSSGSMKWRKNINLLGCTSITRMGIKPRETNASSVKMERSSAKQSVIGVEKSTKSQTIDDEKTADIVQRIRDSILKDGIAVSSPYDTAWTAMVPSPDSPGNPCFPECLKWILENQKSDGSWDSSSGSKTTTVVKEALSSTLACVVALKRWNVNAHEHIEKGLQFLVSNFQFALDEKEYSPLGFNITFPSMVESANALGVKLHINQDDLDTMFQLRDLEMKRGSEMKSTRWKSYIASIAEGIHGNNNHQIMDWNEVIRKYQLQNGSISNSPSATAALLIHRPDANGLGYLRGVLEKLGNAVPAAYPFEVYTKLCIIDSLQKLGIDRYFSDIVENFFSEIYRLWVENDEEIYSDITTRAMAFRLLRMHGYEVSSAVFENLDEDRFYCSSIDENLNDMKTILELYNASYAKLSQDDKVLEKLNSWTSNFLEQKLVSHETHNEIERIFFQEVNHALKFPSYANLERNEHKRNIENFALHNIISMKKSFKIPNTIVDDMLRLAVNDFTTCQSLYRNELDLVESWSKDNRLDQLKSIRQKVMPCYWSTATTSFHPELFDARMSAAKNAILATVVDDFFDISGSIEELENFLDLVQRWDGDYAKDHSISEQVHVIFSALYSTINELGAKASALHNRDVTSHMIEIWLDLINSMMTEAKWKTEMFVPTVDQYMNNGYFSFGLGPIILPTMYFVGPVLPLHFIRSQEYHDLFRLVSTCGRLLNDLQTVEKEAEEGKLNSVSLNILQENGKMCIEDAKWKIKSIIESSRCELLRLVVKSDQSSLIPRACKDLFWMSGRIVHLFYARNDGYTSPTEMEGYIRDVIFHPLNLKSPLPK